MNAKSELDRYLTQFRERLRKLTLARGGALLAVTALVLTLGAVWLGTRRAFNAEFMLGARLVLLVAIVGIVVGLLYVPLRKLRRNRAVPEIERRQPEFDGRIETYEGLAASGRKSPFLGLLAEDALKFARKVPAAIGVSRFELSWPTAVAGVAALTLIGFAAFGPGNWRYGVRDLWAGWFLDDTLPPQFIVVEPGDSTVRRGGDLEVSALAQGFDPSSMQIFARFGPGQDWQSAAMDEVDENGYEFTFYAVRQPLNYYITAAGVRSEEFTVDVVDLPEVSSIKLTYDYPDWTRLDDAVEDPGYDIRAVADTNVTIEVETSEPLTSPSLVVDGNEIPMTAAGNISTGSLTVAEDGEYHVAMLFNDERVQVSDDYFVIVVDDREPEVSVVRPGRDWRANPIEEVTVGVEADDDFGIDSLELRYSVNGSDWTSIPIAASGTEVEGEGIVYLEDQRLPVVRREPSTRPGQGGTLTLDDLRARRNAEEQAADEVDAGPQERRLEPGDLISYYAVATDRENTVQTDLYFIEVQPFDRSFTQADSGGGGGGGGGGEQQQRDEISQRQKEILTATWNLIREQDDGEQSFLDEQQLQDNAEMLAELEQTLAEQAKSLADRAQARRLDGADPRIGRYVENLELAVEAMGPASERLAAVELNEAVGPAQQALQYILRAEALFTDIEVSMQQNQQGGGGGGGLAGRDLSELFELEMDLERNQYETEDPVSFDNQGGGGEQDAQQTDEAIRKLQELAQRQEKLAEQLARDDLISEQERWEQRSLQRETEELLEQLQQQRQQLQQQLAQAQQQGQQQGQQAQQGQQGQQGGQQGQQGQQAQGQPGQQGQQGQPSIQQLEQQLAENGDAIEQVQRALSAMNRGEPTDNDSEAARRNAQTAQEQLEQARDQLTAGRRQRAEEAFSDVAQRASDVYRQQLQAARELRDALEAAEAERDRTGAASARLENQKADELSDRRYDLADDVDSLLEDIQQLAQDYRGQAPGASDELSKALADAQEAQVVDNLEAGASLIWRGDVARVSGFDINISAPLEDLEGATQRAATLATREVVEGDVGEQDPTDQIVAELQDIRRQLSQLTRQGQRGQPGQQQGQQAQQGQQGQQGGQPGQQQAQQGGQGQQAQQGQQGGQQGQQQGGGQQGGGQQQAGGQANGGAFANNGGGFGGPGNYFDVNRSGVWDPRNNDFSQDPAAINQLRDQLQNSGSELINLGAQLRTRGLTDEELAAVRELGDELRAGLSGNPDLVESEFQNLINLTEQLELQLAANSDANETTIRTEAPIRMPQGFEESVAEYYRQLSQPPE